jgi:hypothetical protein
VIFLTGSAAVAIVLLALVGLAVSNVLITREKNEKVAALKQAKINEEAAQTQKTLAENNAKTASEQRTIAIANEKLAKAIELLARRRLYDAHMNLAGKPRTGTLAVGWLRRHVPQPERGLRSWWHYWWVLPQPPPPGDPLSEGRDRLDPRWYFRRPLPRGDGPGNTVRLVAAARRGSRYPPGPPGTITSIAFDGQWLAPPRHRKVWNLASRSSS